MSTTYLIANITETEFKDIVMKNCWTLDEFGVLSNGNDAVHIEFVGGNVELTRYGLNQAEAFLEVLEENYSVWIEW